MLLTWSMNAHIAWVWGNLLIPCFIKSVECTFAVHLVTNCFMSLFSLQVWVQESVGTLGSLHTVLAWEAKNLKPRACCVSAVRRDTVWPARLKGPVCTTAPGAAHSPSVKVGTCCSEYLNDWWGHRFKFESIDRWDKIYRFRSLEKSNNSDTPP